MGGIGKTTLAKNIYDNSFIVDYFHIRAWITISQEFSVREILLDLLREIGVPQIGKFGELHKLGEELYKLLSSRRYLIVMDDMWSIEAWEEVKFFLPDNSNGSRILVTTRLLDVANHFGSFDPYKMKFLDHDSGWNMLCKKVFDQEDCPLELEETGKKIVKNCKGLPLSITVIGGLLAKSDMTRKYWDYIEQNTNSIVNLVDDEHCFKILSLSYTNLPIHLKPCFLYMGVFSEDRKICVSMLIKLWVGEGFLKPNRDKSLEEVAYEYLKDLIDRNLILVHQWGSSGKIKTCYVHDLLRDLCFRESKKHKFFHAITCLDDLDIPLEINSLRRVATHQHIIKYPLQTTSLIRSWISYSSDVLPSGSSKMLRLLNVFDKTYKSSSALQIIFQLVNLRCIAINSNWVSSYTIPSSTHLFWNLQTLIVKRNSVKGRTTVAPYEIWEMRQLRHLKIHDGIVLPDPEACQNDIVLGNLQTLKRVDKFRPNEEVLKRVPNIKKLEIYYLFERIEKCSDYFLNNLGRLHKLESLTCFFHNTFPNQRSDMLQNLAFPYSLKKLALYGCCLCSEDMNIIGSLTRLEVLKLKFRSFTGEVWEPNVGEFLVLKFLLIEDCLNMEYWKADNTHFPSLEHLLLRNMNYLRRSLRVLEK